MENNDPDSDKSESPSIYYVVGGLLIILLFIGGIGLVPVCAIFALNNLFKTGIELTVANYLSALFLISLWIIPAFKK